MPRWVSVNFRNLRSVLAPQPWRLRLHHGTPPHFSRADVSRVVSLNFFRNVFDLRYRMFVRQSHKLRERERKGPSRLPATNYETGATAAGSDGLARPLSWELARLRQTVLSELDKLMRNAARQSSPNRLPCVDWQEIGDVTLPFSKTPRARMDRLQSWGTVGTVRPGVSALQGYSSIQRFARRA